MAEEYATGGGVEGGEPDRSPGEWLFMKALASPYVRHEVDGAEVAEPGHSMAAIRGWLIALLLREALDQVGPGGIEFKHVFIAEGLDLRNFDLPFPLSFERCRFHHSVLFDYATVRHLSFKDCDAVGPAEGKPFQLSLDEARISGSFSIDGFRLGLGSLDMGGTHVGGQLRINRFEVESPSKERPAIALQQVRVGTDLYITEGTAAGRITTASAVVGSDLVFRSLRADVITAGRCQVKDDLRFLGVDLREGIDIQQAEVGGDLTFAACTFDGFDFSDFHRQSSGSDEPTEDPSNPGSGEVTRAESGAPDAPADRLDGRPAVNPLAVSALGVHVGGAFRVNGVRSAGAIEASDSVIGAQCSFDDAEIKTVDGATAISMQNSRIGEGLFFDESSRLLGGFSIAGGEVAGQAAFSGEIANPHGVGLFLRGATFNDSLLLREECRISGRCELSNATVKGTLDLFAALDGREVDAALFAPGLRADNVAVLFGRVKGDVILDDLDCDELTDAPTAWEFEGKYSLAGVRIGRFTEEHGWTRRSRLRWLTDERHMHRGPAPFMQLARYYESQGQPLDARKTMIAMNDVVAPRRRRWTYGLLLRYGYETRRVVIPFLVAFVLTTILVSSAAARDGFRATTPSIAEGQRSSRCTDSYPCLVPWIYALDVMVPVLDLGQDKYWVAVDKSRWTRVVEYWIWFAEAVGWAMTSLLVVGLSLAARRD